MGRNALNGLKTAIAKTPNKIIQNIAINKTETKVMYPKQDLKIYDGIVENEKQIYLAVKEYIKSMNEKIDIVAFDESNKKIIVEAFKFMKKNKYDFYTSYNIFDVFNFVKIPNKNFNMLQTEVTQKLYKFVMGEIPSENELQDKRPVACVSWYDAIYFCNKLSELTGKTPVYTVDNKSNVNDWNYTPHKGYSINGVISQNINANGYRLPTVSEWKYAARGGKDFLFSGSDNIDEVAWYYKNSDKKTHEVGKKKANGYGLHDMSGNVSEWCWDSVGNRRFICGGNFSCDIRLLIIDSEIDYHPASEWERFGFRIIVPQ